MSIEEDRILLTELLKKREPFSFVRFGDGDFECMSGIEGQNADGMQYCKAMGDELIEAYNYLQTLDNCYLSAWCPRRLLPLIDCKVRFIKDRYLHHDSLLTHDLSPNLENFYRALVCDSRRKIYVAPKALDGSLKLLKIDIRVDVPSTDLYSKRDEVLNAAFDAYANDCIYLFSATSLGKIVAAKLIENCPAVTCIDLGSALDPVYIGHTRSHQPPQYVAQSFFERSAIQ